MKAKRPKPAAVVDIDTLFEHWRSMVFMAATVGWEIDDRDHARCFVAGATATLGILRAASAVATTPEAFAQVVRGLQAEVDEFLAAEQAMAAGTRTVQ